MKEEGVESIKLKIDVKLGKLKYYPKEEINGLIFVETVNEINLNSNLESFDIIISLQEKIGQLFIVRVKGLELSDETKKMIREDKIRNFVIFANNYQNITQISKLINDISRSHILNGNNAFYSNR